MLRKFTLFVDRSIVGVIKTNPKVGPSYMKASEIAGAICQFAAMYEGMSPEDRFVDHLPDKLDTSAILLAFRRAYRIECVVSVNWGTHFCVRVKWYKRGEKTYFESIFFYVRMTDGATSFNH